MRDDVMTATYSTPETASALGHGNLGDFRRNLMRGDFLVLPRKTAPGSAGGDYRYGHLVEMLLQMHIGAAFSREIAKSVTFSLFAKLARLPFRPPMPASVAAMSFSADEDRYRFGEFVNYPTGLLGSDAISRDAVRPTYLLFSPREVKHTSEVILVDGFAVTLADAHAQLVKSISAGATIDSTRDILFEITQVPGVVNLTALLSILDERCAAILDRSKPARI